MTQGRNPSPVTKYATSLHLAPDVAEDEVDKIGRAVLIDQARKEGLTITGPVERTYDAFVVGVQASTRDGKMALAHVPVDSPLAEGRTDADARMVSWQADAEPFQTEADAPVVSGETYDGKFARAVLPAAVTESGGMIHFQHSLSSGDVEVTAYDAAGNKIGYEYAVEIAPGEHQVQLAPGAARLEAIAEDTGDNA